MKVILLQDVKSLGKKGEIVNVSDGYARNFVLPKKLGVEANSSNMNDLKLQKANADKVAQEQLAAAKELAAGSAQKSGEELLLFVTETLARYADPPLTGTELALYTDTVAQFLESMPK